MNNHWLSTSTTLDVSYFELLALHRAIVEAKFGHDQANDVDILGSPLLSNLANRVVETLVAMETKTGKDSSAARWKKWRLLDPSRREWGIIAQRLKNCDQWKDWTADERSKYLDCVISPFQLSDDQRRHFLCQL
jgi:hypothetical protein